MKTKTLIFSILFFCSSILVQAQTGRLKGIVLDEYNLPVANVNIMVLDQVTQTDPSGFYLITVPSGKKLTVYFTHISLKKVTATMLLKQNEDYEFNIQMNSNAEQMDEVIIVKGQRKRAEGITIIEPEVIRRIPGANAGVENIIKTLPGVYSNNELSTQYAVRGGNYDENLVYVNEIEVYRPFLVRSGQQEGLSFTNTDLVQNVDFSAGGFQAKYGDKLSSVLDITYRRPTKFAASAEVSLLGGSLSAEAVSKNQKWAAIAGVRYRDNSLLVNSQETETNFKPKFADLQANILYDASTRWQWSFLGNIAQNRYDYTPLSRQTNFGTIDEPIALQVFYEGQEKDRYDTFFGALKTTYQVNENFTLKLIASAYHTLEKEYFDIQSNYSFGELDTNIGSDTVGDIVFTQEAGSHLNQARND